MNHLKYEKSPYLLQHRDNPVDWYPWGDEAFEKAAREEKPVFLSVGYSTCHWCHVMAHESFEDNKVAELLNRYFVAVKVDREERPDVDAVYMAVCQALTGGGGWPMTVLLTPDKKPFFAGTYLPKKSRYGMIGLTELLDKMAELWKHDRENLVQTGERIVAAINRDAEKGQGEELDVLLSRGVHELKGRFDARFGGFDAAPKFPAPHNLIFLLRYGLAKEDSTCLDMVEKTLEFMARGGIFDQIGGGFSRYSTDTKWLVPHFEKMLYDNALLAEVYLEAYTITKKPFYKKIIYRIFKYVERELLAPEGAFYCGQDADSDGVEGKYYVFTKGEIEQFLGDEAEEFCQWFGISEKGNFEGKNIPNLLENSGFEHTPDHIEKLCERVYDYRKERASLHRDDKILTSWNAMMISVCARAGFLLEEDRYVRMARRAEQFIWEKLVNETGRIMVRYREGQSAYFGNLEEYAYYCLALLTLYDTTLNAAYLKRAVQQADRMVALFWDEDNGGFYFYGSDDEELIHRPKEIYDGAMPSGNAVAAYVLHLLFQITAENKWRELRDKQIDFLASEIGHYPSGYSFSLMVFGEILNPGPELICVSKEERVPQELWDALKRWKGGKLSVIYKCPSNAQVLSELAPFTDHYPLPESGTQYYFCENQCCSRPFSSLSERKDLFGEDDSSQICDKTKQES